MNTDERQRTNQVRIEVARTVRELRVLGGLESKSVESTNAMLDRMERILDTLAPAGDPSVAEVAATFEVSVPTIRKWIREGLLERGTDARTTRVSFESVARLDEILERVRATLPERDLTKALAAYLHDRDLLNMPWARDGIAARKARRPEDRVKL